MLVVAHAFAWFVPCHPYPSPVERPSKAECQDDCLSFNACLVSLPSRLHVVFLITACALHIGNLRHPNYGLVLDGAQRAGGERLPLRAATFIRRAGRLRRRGGQGLSSASGKWRRGPCGRASHRARAGKPEQLVVPCSRTPDASPCFLQLSLFEWQLFGEEYVFNKRGEDFYVAEEKQPKVHSNSYNLRIERTRGGSEK